MGQPLSNMSTELGISVQLPPFIVFVVTVLYFCEVSVQYFCEGMWGFGQKYIIRTDGKDLEWGTRLLIKV